MKISKDLNLVVPVKTEAGTFYVHSTPILYETFKRYFLVLSKTLNRIHAEGIQIVGPRVAALMLEEIAKEMGQWEGVAGVENGLMNEISRLSNVIMPTERGWQSIPLDTAFKQGHLTAQEVHEVGGFIIFFTCVWHIHKRSEVEAFLELMVKIWGTQVSLLSCMEYRDSLPTLTETEIFVPTVKQSSIPG